MRGGIPGEWNSLHRQVERGSARGLCGLSELVPATGASSHETDQATAPRDKEASSVWPGLLVQDGQAIACVFYTKLRCICAVVHNLESNKNLLLVLKAIDLVGQRYGCHWD